jgi:hypothetical protein
MAKWASNGERILRLDSGVTVSADEIILRIYWLRKENAELRERAERAEGSTYLDAARIVRDGAQRFSGNHRKAVEQLADALERKAKEVGGG